MHIDTFTATCVKISYMTVNHSLSYTIF